MSKLSITLPRIFAPEIEYVLHVFFKQHYKILEYDIFYGAEDFCIINNEIGEIKIKNEFFKGDEKTLFTIENLPKENIVANINIGEKTFEINALYGYPTLSKVGSTYELGTDIFAASFLLLTQWEYNVTDNKDQLGRVKLVGSTIDKFSLYQKPIVNQYIEALGVLLESIGQKISGVTYKASFSCDVDSITKYKSLRNLLGSFYHMKLIEYPTAVGKFVASKINKVNDPYYSAFEYIFEKLNKKKMEAVFYFMASVTDKKYDTKDYELKEDLIQTLVSKMRKFGYSIGIHPSINSWKEASLIGRDIQLLSEVFNQKISMSRQHFLRYDINQTWTFLELNGIDSDSSVQFTEGAGFAAGICTPYNLFDLRHRKMLSIIEHPLLIMIKKDYAINYEKQLSKIADVIAQAKKYNGNFSVLFHNSNLETKRERMFFDKVMELV